VTGLDLAAGVHVAGFGVHTGFGFGHACLLDAMMGGESAARRRFFDTRYEASMSGFGFNPQVVPLAGMDADEPYPQLGAEDVADVIYKVIADALERAGIPLETLAQRRVSVFCGTPGMQPEGARFLYHIRQNDREDVASRPGLHGFHADNHHQDKVARLLREMLGLKQTPISVYSASSSGLVATWLAYCAITSNTSDLALAVSFQHIALFDLMFMHGFGGIADGKAGPFSATAEGTILGDGACAMVLESGEHLKARNGTPYIAIDHMVMRQSAGATSPGATFTPDFRIIDRTIEAALAPCAGADIACVFPHANGVRSSDRAEAMVLQKRWGGTQTPIVSYKAQLGYTMASSTLLDLAIMSGCLDRGELPAFQCDGEIDTGLGLPLHAKTATRTLAGKVGVKIGLGVEGSVGVLVLRALRGHAPSSATLRPARPAPPEIPQLGLYGLSVIEPPAQHLRTFAPRWYNAWEARLYADACKARAQTCWALTRFGGGAQDASTTREIAQALELSSRAALDQGRKAIGRLDKARLALLYFDAWGQASYLEPSGSWKDAFSTDVIPWKVLKALQVGAFSCKLRAGRGAFMDALRLVSHLLNADSADAVLVGGLYRFHPVLGFSRAAASANSEQRWLGRKGAYRVPVIERAGFALIGRAPPTGSDAIRLTLPPATALPKGFDAASAGLRQYFARTAQTASTIIGGISPSSALAELETRAARAFNPDAAYLNTSALYGESGGVTPLLALSHYQTLPEPAPALVCLESTDGDAQALLLERAS